MEFKLGHAEMPYGQCLALMRNIDNNQKAGKESTLFVCEHNQEDCEQDVNAADAIVRKFYYNHKWYQDGKHTVREKVDGFIKFIDDPF